MKKSILNGVLFQTIFLAGTFLFLLTNATASNIPAQDKISQVNSYQVASANQVHPFESKLIGDELVANRGEGSSRVQIHYSKLKELDKFDKESLSNKTKIMLWQDFIILFPHDNPYLAEAKEIIRNLGEKKLSSRTKETLDQKIIRRYDFLIGLEKQTISLEKKIDAWSGFVRDFPIDNPKFNTALSKITELRKEQERLAQEKGLVEEAARREEQIRLVEQNRLAGEEAERKEQERLAQDKGLAEEAARRVEHVQLAEQNRLAGEEAERKEQERLAQEKSLAAIKLDEIQVARLEPSHPKPSPNKLTGHEGMALIPAGKYVYGDPNSQETKILEAFYMDVQEVTQKDFEQVMGKNPSRFKGDNLPVERVNWQDAKDYCKRTGKRLPTSQEWEKAARADTSSEYYWGATLGKNNANCNDCGSQWDGLETAPVRSFPPNAWGLYDMAGNVWEWVDESHNKIFKVLRGGSWMDDSSFISTAASYFVLPENKSNDIGFRCAK